MVLSALAFALTGAACGSGAGTNVSQVSPTTEEPDLTKVLYTRSRDDAAAMVPVPELPNLTVIYPMSVERWMAPDGSGRKIATLAGEPRFPGAAMQASFAGQGFPQLLPDQDTTWTAEDTHLSDSQALPTDPQALAERLSTEGSPQDSEAVRLLRAVQDKLELPVSAALRSALIQALVSIEGVEITEGVDSQGRPGTTVALTDTNQGVTTEWSITFDSAGYLAEARSTVVATDQAGFDAPAVLTHTVILDRQWVDRVG